MGLVWTARGWRVRTFTPVECERLQGMPDHHTLVPGASDSTRYHAIGNSLPVPVVRWIGERVWMALEQQRLMALEPQKL